jgi:dUTP pyrophosphatase
MNFETMQEKEERANPSLKIKVEVVEGGTMPTKANDTDCGFDCYVRSKKHEGQIIKYKLGFKIEIPKGFGGFIFPRSSIYKYDLSLSNCVGVIDPGFANEVSTFFRRESNQYSKEYAIGDRCCQLIILPLPKIELINEKISEENTREGYGSSGE